MSRVGFTCGRLAMIHSRRVRTELFPIAGSPLVGVPLRMRRPPASSKNSCSSTSATPMPPSPPATQRFRPRLRCERANDTARGNTWCTNVCRPCLPVGRCTRSTRGATSRSVSSERASASVDWGWVVSPGGVSDAYTRTNAVSPSSASDPHVLGMLTGRSRGRSVKEQRSTRPPTFSTGDGVACHDDSDVSRESPSLPGRRSDPVPWAPATSLARRASSSSREHDSNSARWRQNSWGFRP